MARWKCAVFGAIVCLSSIAHGEADGAGEGPADERMPMVAAVIGGHKYEAGKWPWLVSLQGKVPTATFFGIPLAYRQYYCGASLLNDRWILTAAHCFPTEDLGYLALLPRYWHIRLGHRELTADLKHKLQRLIGRLLNIDKWKQWYIHGEKIFIHPGYDSQDTWRNDIALIKLREPVPAGQDIIPQIQSVALPAPGDTRFPADGARCIMVGWGCTSQGGRTSHNAREVELPKLSDEDCARFWRVSTSARLCAGNSLAHKGICPGDSGGPLVCKRGDTWVQVGIASFTSLNTPGDVPGAFTRVSPFVDWIRDTIRDN